MKLSAAFAILNDLTTAIRAALPPTLSAVWNSPTLLFRPTALSKTFMASVWIAFGDSVDAGGRHVKEALIAPNAFGVVLDLGAGHGHTVNYLDRAKVTKYVALEPNTLMHASIRANASKAGYDESAGSLQILECGAEDVTAILIATAGQQVDTIISVLTLCSVPSPERTIRELVQEVLRPEGYFLFYEHVLSDRKDVAWWQHFWTPIWSLAFDGCRLDRPTHRWIEDQGTYWQEGQAKKCEGEEENLFGHRLGKFVKA